MIRARVWPAAAAAVARIVVLVTAALVAPPAGSRAEDDVVGEAVTGQPEEEQGGNLIDTGVIFQANVLEQAVGFVMRQPDVVRDPRGVPAMDGDADAPLTARLRTAGAARLSRVVRICTLAADQRRKLELAIESDIQGCVAEIEKSRQRYVGMQVNLRDKEGQKQWVRFQQDVQRCRRMLVELFEEGSLFAESLTTVLDEGQLSALASEAEARRSFRWQALVAKTMLRLDDAMALTQDQHAEIERLLLEKEPRLRVDGVMRQEIKQAEQMLVFMVLGEIDQKALKAIVGEDRWKTVVGLANQGRSMRSWIEGQGLLEPKRK